jgi:hypothetical protein
MLLETTQWRATSPEELRAIANTTALGLAQGKAASFALDGDVVLIVVAAPDRVSAVLDRVLGDAAVDWRQSAEAPRPKARSAAAALALGAWTGDDLVASVQAAAGPLSFARAGGDVPVASFLKGGQGATVSLASTDPRAVLARLNGDATPFAYALDGGKLLFVVGSPAFTTVNFVKTILAGARAAEVGARPPR